MSKVKIELNSPGIRELLLSDEVKNFTKETADGCLRRCGPGYESDSCRMPGRWISSVFTADREAVNDNLENNTLLRSLS